MSTQGMAKSPERNSVEGKLVSAIIIFGVFFAVACMILPQLSNRHRRSKTIQVINHLMQIENAKQMWASDHNVTGAVQITESDLAEYFGWRGSNALVNPIDGEVYTVKPLGVPPEARLTRKFGGLPKGSVIRLGPGGLGFEMIAPDGTVLSRFEASRSGETNRTVPAVGQRPLTTTNG